MNMKVCMTSITAAAAMLLSVSCSKYRAPKFPVERDGRWEIISGELYVQVSDIWEYDSVLVVPSYDRQTKRELGIYRQQADRTADLLGNQLRQRSRRVIVGIP